MLKRLNRKNFLSKQQCKRYVTCRGWHRLILKQVYIKKLAKALNLVVNPALPKKNGFKAIGGVSHV